MSVARLASPLTIAGYHFDASSNHAVGVSMKKFSQFVCSAIGISSIDDSPWSTMIWNVVGVMDWKLVQKLASNMNLRGKTTF